MRRSRMLAAAVLTASAVCASASAGGIGFRLAVVNVDGTHRQRLMNDMQVDLFDFSPDRRRVVFARICGVCASGLYVSNPKKSKAQRILATDTPIYAAYWSPDGRRIAFGVAGTLNGTSNCGQSVWTIRSDGSDLRLVSDCALLARNSGTNEQPWSPGSTRIAFVAHFQPPKENIANLVVANYDGSARRDYSSVIHVQDAAWSPRARWIAISSWEGAHRGNQLTLVDVGSGSATPMGRGSSPSWSHNGRRLAFVDGPGRYRSRASVGTISVGPTGLHRRRLDTTHVVGGTLIAWSPNDHALAFVGCRASRFCKQPEVYFVGSRGNGLHQLTNEHDIATVVFEGIWWTPSGSRLFFSRYRLGA